MSVIDDGINQHGDSSLIKKIFKTIDFHLFYRAVLRKSVSVATRSKAWGCSRSFIGIAGSNPAGDMDICLLWVLHVVLYRSLRRADDSSRGALECVVCLSMIVQPRQRGGPGPLGAVVSWKKITYRFKFVRLDIICKEVEKCWIIGIQKSINNSWKKSPMIHLCSKLLTFSNYSLYYTSNNKPKKNYV
jgi:hypothetical protein